MSGLRLSVLTGVAGLFALSGCMGDPLPKQSLDFPIASYPKWRAEDATYRFYPGDKFRVDVRTAPELSGEFTVAPDGRIALPTIGAIMAGGQTVGELKGAIDVLQAILLAGGWTEEGKPTHVIVMRRVPGGELMTRVVDVRNGLARNDLYDIGPLHRFDVVYVSRKMIADENLFVKQFIRDALPIDFSLFYDIARF